MIDGWYIETLFYLRVLRALRGERKDWHEVHRALGPGLLESTYEQCLAWELDLSGISFKLQSPLPVEYKGIKLDF